MGYRSILFKAVCGALSLLLLMLPVLGQQQDAANQARADARAKVNGGTWLIIGIFLGVIGYAIALLSPPRTPASALIGKSPDYVAVYSETFEEEGKKIQMRKALTGCLIGTGIQVALSVVLIAAASSSLDY